MSSIDPLPPLHPPGRSKTRAAWSALLILLLLLLLFFFHSVLLRISVRSVLWILQPVTGLTIKAEKMEVLWGKGIHWDQMTISAGREPYATQLTFQDCSIEFSSWWRFFFGDHLLITSWQATKGRGIIDLRTTTIKTSTFWKNTFPSLTSSISQKLELLPASVQLRDLSFLLLTEGERYTVNHLTCTLPNKTIGYPFSSLNSKKVRPSSDPPRSSEEGQLLKGKLASEVNGYTIGQLTYESILIEAGTVHCHLAAGKAQALWNGRKMMLHQLSLADEIMVHNLTIVPHHDRIELGIVAEAFEGLIRADGSLHHTPKGTFIDSALLGEHLPLGRLSRFLGLQKNLAGTIREGRLTFRGFLLHPFDAEASLRMLADNVRLEKRGWAALSINANLIGRKISLTDFQLKQHENRVVASGEMTLPKEWYKIAQAPFLLKLKANITDASQLADLVGTSWKNMTGKLLADGEVHGAANCAEGYLNVQGTAMTAYGLPLNSLKFQLLFQGEKTNLTNLEIWSGSDRLECSGVVENKWPHRYEGKATIESSDLSEKLIPLLRQHYTEVPQSCVEFIPSSFFEKPTLQGGSFKASWEGYGEAAEHKGSFHITLHDLCQGVQKISGQCEGYYGREWLAFPSLVWEASSKKYRAQLVLSSRGIDLKNFSLTEDDVTTLSGSAFLPCDSTMLFHQPFSLSRALLRDLPLAVHLQCNHWNSRLPRHENNERSGLKSFPFTRLPSFLDGRVDATGLLEKPSLHISLLGKNSITEKNNLKMKFHLSSEQGEGIIDAALAITKNKAIVLQGKLPVGLIFDKESSPLQEEHWQLGPSSTPLDLRLSIPSLDLDEAIAHYFPSFFHVKKSLLSANLTCKGTWNQPEPSGELQFQAESISMANNITPLHHLQGRFLFNKDKMELSDTTAWMEKEKMTFSGITEWYHQKQEYHFSGTHLPLYQSESMTATGDLNLSLQGENHKGTLRGNITLQEIKGPSTIAVTPFLIPPGINAEIITCSPQNGATPWNMDISMTTPPERNSSPPPNASLGAINLHLLGDLFSPTLEGSILLQHLPITFPKTTMSLIQGSCNFDASKPWQPIFQLTASGKLRGKKVTATLLQDQTLQLQSDPFVAPTTLALELASSSSLSPETQESWLSQLPYWVREQSLTEPTTLFQVVEPKNERDDLGFTGCGISYQAEVK